MSSIGNVDFDPEVLLDQEAKDALKKTKAAETAQGSSSSAAAAGSTHSFRSPNVSLFNIPSNLGIAPVLTGTSSDEFSQWKTKFKNYMMSNSITKIVTLSESK